MVFPNVIESSRLILRPIRLSDADFVLTLFNDEDCIRHIGDKGIYCRADAENYIHSGPLAMYAEQGFGLLLAENKESGQSLGMCGLIKRQYLSHPDIGFAFLPQHRRKGYTYEAALGIIQSARHEHGLAQLAAITSLHNDASIALLLKLGFEFEQIISVPPAQEPARLFYLQLGKD